MRLFAACCGKNHASQSPTNFAVILKLCNKNPVFRAAKSNQCFARHPLRAIKQRVDAVLKKLSPLFDALYSQEGRASIPPEQLLKAGKHCFLTQAHDFL
jgi:hypothetical protein